jgi:hypothetical protein
MEADIEDDISYNKRVNEESLRCDDDKAVFEINVIFLLTFKILSL